MSNEEKGKIPTIRFKGYTDVWKQCKLGNLSQISRGASPRPIQDPKWFDKNSDIGWLRIADVTEQNGRITYLEQKISKLAEEKTRVLLTSHLLLSIAATVGKPVINYVKTGVHDGFLIFYRPQFNQEYMFQWLEMFRPKWQKYGQPGSQVNLNSELVKNQDIFIPKMDEQKEISSFLKSLDDAISIHHRKLDVMRIFKKTLLAKTFPNEGETIPEVRFSGFTDAWEQRNIENLAKSFYGGGTPKTTNDSYWKGDIPWVQSSNLLSDNVQEVFFNKFISENAIKESAAKLIPEHSIAIVTRVGVGKLALINREFSTSQDFLSLSDLTINEQFGVYSLYNSIKKELKSIQGTSIKGITKSYLLSKEISIPGNLSEQAQIGTFFKEVDNLITLHQRKLDILKNLKKSLLKHMFV